MEHMVSDHDGVLEDRILCVSVANLYLIFTNAENYTIPANIVHKPFVRDTRELTTHIYCVKKKVS